MPLAKLLRKLLESGPSAALPFRPTLEVLEDRTHCAVDLLSQPLLAATALQPSTAATVTQQGTLTTSVALTTSTTAASVGSQVTLVARVTTSATEQPVRGGTVTFVASQEDGSDATGVALATVPVDASGTAVLPVSVVSSVGAVAIQASYSGAQVFQSSVSQETTVSTSSSSAATVNGVLDRLFSGSSNNTGQGLVATPRAPAEGTQEQQNQPRAPNGESNRLPQPLPEARSRVEPHEDVAPPPPVPGSRPESGISSTARAARTIEQELADALLSRDPLPPPDAGLERDSSALQLYQLLPGGRVVARLLPRMDSSPGAVAVLTTEEGDDPIDRKRLPLEDGPFTHMIGLNLEGHGPVLDVPALPLSEKPASDHAEQQDEEAPLMPNSAWYVLAFLMATWLLLA